MRILVACPGRSQVDVALRLCRLLPEIEFHICAEYINPDGVSKLGRARNVRRVDLDAAAMRAADYSHLVTFGCTSHLAHQTTFRLGLHFARLDLPTIDVQHGLFLEHYTLPPDAPFNPHVMATDIRVSWSEYGLLAPDPVPTRRSLNHVVGIATNMHWSVYSDRERLLFRRSILDLARRRKDLTFLWRQHPAEFLYKPPRSALTGVVASNMHVIDFHEVERFPIERFLADVDFLITTPSTTLTDAELSETPCTCLHARGLAPHVARFRVGAQFRSPAELASQVDDFYLGRHSPRFRSGYSKTFDVERFRELLDEVSRPAMRSLARSERVSAMREAVLWRG